MKFIFKHLGKVITETKLEDGKTYFIGRQEDCDFILEDTSLSRQHIKIYQSEETQNWIIECVSTQGGLYFQAEEIDGLELEDSASLFLKSFTFEFVIEENNEETNNKNLPSVLSEQASDSSSQIDSSGDASKDSSQLDNTSLSNFAGKTKILNNDSLIHSLHIYVEDESSDHVELSKQDSWILGRSKDCDIFIDYKVLSRKHLKITKSDSVFTIQDLGTANGSNLNDKTMAAKKNYPFQSDDHISIGELNIVFEVRNKDFEQMMENLPVVQSENTNTESSSQKIMPFPKVILEDTTEDENYSSNKKKFFNIKRIIMFLVVGLILGSALFFSLNKEDESVNKENQARSEKANTIKKSYDLSVRFLQQENYQACIDELTRLHQLTPYYEDSKKILNHCQNAAENKRQEIEMLEQDKKRKATEEEVKKIVAACQAKASSFESVEELNACAEKALELDPSNNIIAMIKREIEEKEIAKKLKADARNNYRKTLASKMYLYNKAEKISKKGNHLKTIAAYKAFLRSAKGIKSLSKLSIETKERIDNMQTEYNNNLNALYANCENLINEEEMKKAFYVCKDILKFKENDKKALAYINQAKDHLRDKLKSTYQKSVLAESLSSIDQAQELWNEILSKDIKEGYYYKKARVLLEKYN